MTSPAAAPPVDPAPPGGRLGGWTRALAVAAIALGALEAGLALAALGMSRGAAACPDYGPVLACAAIGRPRLASLGPARVADVAFLGAMASLGLALVSSLAALRGDAVAPRLTRATGLVLAPAAGFALGLQSLPWVAAGTACPVCLALAVVATLLATSILILDERVRRARPLAALAGLLLALGATLGVALPRGLALAEEDARREAAVRALEPGDPRGATVVVVTREGCPWCRALVADVLADPAVLDVLRRAHVVDLVTRDDPRARAHGVRGVPVVLVLGPDGALRGRLEGYDPDVAAYSAALAPLVDGR